MPTPVVTEVTQLLIAWSEGDSEALDRLIPLVYQELRQLARHHMRKERVEHTLETTALIHEAYLRLIDAKQVQIKNRAHFFGVSARLMRQILVDAARARGYEKRGGGAQQVSLDAALTVTQKPEADLLAIDEALSALATLDLRKSQVVEMRFFGGLTEAEIATVLDVSIETVKRDWRLAKSWLRMKLDGGTPDAA